MKANDRFFTRLKPIPVLFLGLFCLIGVQAQSARQWREDLRYLASEMPRTHKNLFHAVSRKEFETAVNSLHKRIPVLSRNQIVVGLARIVAMIGDGHTRMGLVPNRLGIDEKIGFRRYPLKLYFYKDGLFVQSISRENQAVVGGQLVKIGKTPIEQAVASISKIAFRDNEMTVKDRVPYLVVVPEILQGLGLIADSENGQFTVEKDGRQIVIEVRPNGKDERVNWVETNDETRNPIPLWLKNPADNYWFEYLKDSHTLYLQYNSVADKKEESFALFCKRLFAFVEANPVDKFVIDLRHNEGGNSELNWHLIYGLIRSDKINQPGKLFTIIGRSTFSAAVNCAAALEKHTKTIFVGEPTGSSPNMYGDTKSIVLPHSKITVEVSTLWHQESGAHDRRSWLAPQIAANLMSEDYRKNEDPAMRAILGYVPGKSLSETLLEALKSNDLAAVIREYTKFKEDPVHAYADTESEINNLGYHLLEIGQVDQAVVIFKLNVQSYPRSWNTYDSLGEAYLKSGDKRASDENYKKSLEIKRLYGLKPNTP